MYKLQLKYNEIKKVNELSNFIIRTADNAIIPMDEENSDYQAYLAWVEAGNQPLPADEVTV
jgi:hypothetical protein